MNNLRYIPQNRYSDITDEAKLILSICFSIIILISHTLETQIIVLVILVLVSTSGGLKLGFMLNYLKLFLPVIAIIFILHLFYHDGKPLFKLWFLTATDYGLHFAMLNLLRFVNFILIAISFFSFGSPFNISSKLATGFGLAKNRFFQELALVFFIALRFLPVLTRERESLKLAMRARGANFRGGLIGRLKKNIKLVFPLLMRVISQTDDVALALALKGDGSTYFVPEKSALKIIDISLIAIGIIGVLVVAIYG